MSNEVKEIKSELREIRKLMANKQRAITTQKTKLIRYHELVANEVSKREQEIEQKQEDYNSLKLQQTLLRALLREAQEKEEQEDALLPY